MVTEILVFVINILKISQYEHSSLGDGDEICFDKTAALLQHSGQNDIPVIEYRSDDVTKTKFMKLWNLLRYSEST